jgi:hypothetical protein
MQKEVDMEKTQRRKESVKHEFAKVILIPQGIN